LGVVLFFERFFKQKGANMALTRTPLDQNQIAIARKLGLSDDFMRILAMRGLTEESAKIRTRHISSFAKLSPPFFG
jgi:hypothetical protein